MNNILNGPMVVEFLCYCHTHRETPIQTWDQLFYPLQVGIHVPISVRDNNSEVLELFKLLFG